MGTGGDRDCRSVEAPGRLFLAQGPKGQALCRRGVGGTQLLGMLEKERCVCVWGGDEGVALWVSSAGKCIALSGLQSALLVCSEFRA